MMIKEKKEFFCKKCDWNTPCSRKTNGFYHCNFCGTVVFTSRFSEIAWRLQNEQRD